jgi:protease I
MTNPDAKKAALPQDMFAPDFHSHTNGCAVLILTADNTQDLEFFYPYYRLTEEGYDVQVATPNGGELTCEKGMGIKNTLAIADVDAHPYCLLYIPGGKAPEALKKNKAAIALTREFAESGKIIAALCHGPQLLAAADVIKGRAIAAWPQVQAEVEKAGAVYKNETTVVDGNFVTARWPADLPSHLLHTLQLLREQQLKTGTPVSVLRASQGV